MIKPFEGIAARFNSASAAPLSESMATAYRISQPAAVIYTCSRSCSLRIPQYIHTKISRRKMTTKNVHITVFLWRLSWYPSCVYILEMKIPPVSFISPPHAPAPRSRRYPRGLGPGPFRYVSPRCPAPSRVLTPGSARPSAHGWLGLRLRLRLVARGATRERIRTELRAQRR